METKAGAQISAKSFFQSVSILFVLMILAGVLTRVVPAGEYQRVLQDGREVVDPASFQYVTKPHYPVWRWFTAPFEALAGPDGLMVIVIAIFVLMVGGSFAILEKIGILKAVIGKIVRTFDGKKYTLLLAVSFFFMVLGAFFGIFEEMIPLVPLMLALSYYLGWDAFVGLGMSVLATNLGFSAAITNPFTIGVAQKIAHLPLFSGAWFRIPIFIVIYAILAFFLVRYAKKIEKNPQASSVFAEDKVGRAKYENLKLEDIAQSTPNLRRAMAWFLVCILLLLFVLISGPFVSVIADYALPLVGVLFFLGGVGAGLVSGYGRGAILKALWEGVAGFSPGIILFLMAVSVKHIVVQGGIMDSILHGAAQSFSQTSPLLSAIIIYFLALIIELFVSSGSAKALLMMPILLPLADLVGVTRQVTVTAYCFGDGFSNMIYPTNPVLLIVLGLTTVSYPKWLRWTLPLWGVVILVTILFLAIAVAIGYGPF